MKTTKFSITPETQNPFLDDAAINLLKPGYAEYWLVEQGLVVIPTSDETQEFWEKYLTKIRTIQSNSDTKTLEQLGAELDAVENCLAYWAEHFLQKYFFIETHLNIKSGVASEHETERHFAIIEHDKARKDWNQEVGSLSEEELQEELDNAANDHHALNAMLTQLHRYRSSDDPLSDLWMFDKSFLSSAHKLEFYSQSWEKLCDAYKTEIQKINQSSDGDLRRKQLHSGANRLVVKFTEIIEIAEEHWQTIIQIKNAKHGGKLDLETLAEYLEESLFLKYKPLNLEQLDVLKEEFEQSISAMNTMQHEAFSLLQSFETVPE